MSEKEKKTINDDTCKKESNENKSPKMTTNETGTNFETQEYIKNSKNKKKKNQKLTIDLQNHTFNGFHTNSKYEKEK